MKLFLNTKQIFFYLFTALLISSCSSDEDEVDDIPELINEEEVITVTSGFQRPSFSSAN